jgi:hypothetical protein
MPKTPKTAIKQAALPLEVHASGDPWQPSGDQVATVPLPNDVIITKIEGPFTERDRKLWAFLIRAVWDDLLTTRIHEIRVSKINAVFEQLGGDTSSGWIWESARRLSRTIIEWTEGADGSRIKAAGISNMMNARVSKEARATGYLQFEIPALLSDVIRKPCYFSRLRLHFMIGLSGKYAVTLYMLLESVANRQTPVLDVELSQLRQWLNVPEGKLNRWIDIKRRILEPALKQINENPEAAGFLVVMNEFKECRAVNRVRFTLTKTAGRLADEKALKPKAIEQPKVADSSSALKLPSLPNSAYEQAKKAAPGLDIYYLEIEWRNWIVKKPPAGNLAGAFVEFCRKRYEKNNQR